MSPRPSDPLLPNALMEAAAQLLAQEGVAALTTRRLAAAVGASTSAVYTHFGGMEDLVRALVHEGFARLHRRMSRVQPTADPVCDIMTLGYAYRANALRYPQLYLVMFGSSALGGFALADDDRQHGRYTLESLMDGVARAQALGRFRDDDVALVAQQMWIALHGLVTLDLGGYLVDPYDADTCFEAQLRTMMLGAGDDLRAVTASQDKARQRKASADAPLEPLVAPAG